MTALLAEAVIGMVLVVGSGVLVIAPIWWTVRNGA
jgi:hypothetical protein